RGMGQAPRPSSRGPLTMTGHRRWIGFGALLLVAGPASLAVRPASAKPAHRKAFADYSERFLGAGLNNCGACHVSMAPSKPPASLADFPHNPFGDRLRRVREELRARGARTDIPGRLRAVAPQD